MATRSDGSPGRYWLAVVSRAHVLRGVEHGFAQANHGKRAAIARMRPGDGLVYYSPREGIRDGSVLKAFTALGVIADHPEWQAEPPEPYTSADFQPWRRKVDYRTPPVVVPIDDLRAELELTSRPNWGIVLRRGLLELSANDFAAIERAWRAAAEQAVAGR